MRGTRIVLLFGLVAGIALLAASSVPAATNLIANGGFEGSGSGSLSGWAASGGSLSLVAGSGGGHAGRVTPANGASQSYAYTSSKPAKSIVSGTAYTLAGSVRSDRAGTSVCLKIKEVPSGGSSTVGSAQQCVTATSTWQQFPAVAYTAKTSGDSLTVNVVESSPPAGATFDIDDLSLTTGPADTTAPSVPQNVAASATGASSAHVSWDAAHDDVGVAGYDVFRDGAKVKTVNGTATSFDDTALAPQTSYSYTVDAFDGAGNTSGPSGAADVTTPPGSGGGSGPCGLVPPSTRPYSHVVVIMEENLTVQAWQAASEATYTHHLADDCRFESNAAGETHPSFPNYLAVASGTFEVCLACSSAADNIFHQAGAAGLTWKGYNQSMPKNCSGNTSSVPYYRSGHNPAFWFTNLGPASKGGDGSCATKDVPLDPALWNDIAADHLPSFSWVTPDDCRDMHWMNGPCETVTGMTKADRIRVGDQYVQSVVSAIEATPSYQAGDTLIIVTWDESNELSVKDKGNWGIDCSNPTVYANNKATCQVITILVSARLPAGPYTAFTSHYALTAAIEQTLGLPLLGGARTATPAPIY
jgi:Phosphoesterase family/Fibronectin type III domain